MLLRAAGFAALLCISGMGTALEASEDQSSSNKPSEAALAAGDSAEQAPGEAEDPLANYSSAKSEAKTLKLYQEAFREKRVVQVATAESIVDKGDYVKQYALVKVLVDPTFRTLRQAQKNLTGVDLASLPPIPNKNRTILESALNVWEGTALLGDLILRLPDILHRMIDNHALRKEVLNWAVRLCAVSPMYEPTHRTQLELVLQEMGLADVPDPTYSNPFSEASRRKRAIERAAAKAAQEAEIERLIERKRRGPQLSRRRYY
eukprot:m.35561 g.35561  ORF g.35561 m.35561 type:complete len:262 (+) comp7453_c0_seq1:173-958(+)